MFITHPSLGALSYDEGLNWYEGPAVADGDRVHVNLSLDACDDENTLLAIAERRVVRLGPIVKAAKQYAAASLLDEINTQWLATSEKPMSLAELVNRFCARSLIVFPDGCQEIHLGPALPYRDEPCQASVGMLSSCDGSSP
ncbi:MAG: DUF2262 domain-containing protein [Burkholderiales bacterium]|nr:DUF2262 domain-containing protein [Burkholderiales bacterium]